MFHAKTQFLALASIILSLSLAKAARAGVEQNDAIATDVTQIAQFFAGFQTTIVPSRAPAIMVRDYLQVRYQGDRSIIDSFQIVLQATAIAADRSEAGMIDMSVAEQEVNREIDRRMKEASGLSAEKQNALAAQAALARQALSHLVRAEVGFGYDGREQNGCAAATSYLLIFDGQSQRVFGIDLEPCDGE